MEQLVVSHRCSKSTYEKLIADHLMELTDQEMAILLALYENRTVELAATKAGASLEDINTVLERFLPRPIERQTKAGKVAKKRLSQTALRSMVENVDDFTERERTIFSALADAPNQTAAALSIGMTYKEFASEYMAIRRKHDI